jgi:FtsP/CotA-like multicopper oxidase with cupredoxin domain
MEVRTLALRSAVALGALVGLGLAAWVAKAWFDSRLPDSYSAMDYGQVDYGGGPPHDHGRHAISLETLRGPSAEPDFRMTLVAKQTKVKLATGRTFSAWTFNGQVPGPELRVHQGDVVEITLVNEDIDDGVTIHWHGVDVPNAEDGVAGVTQDAVMPGGRHIYRFRADQVGTFWYHSHQVSSKQVRRGLYGAFVIEPKAQPARRHLDLTAIAHDFSGRPAIGSFDGIQRRPVAAGTPVRLRLVNSNGLPEEFSVAGTPFRVVAIDGTDLNGPTPVENKQLVLGGGARYDIAFVMPRYAVRLGIEGSRTSLVLEPDPDDHQVGATEGPTKEDFDALGYGKPKPTLLGSTTHFDRTFELDIGRRIGFVNGRPGYHWAVNGKLFPDTPMYMVSRGDRVKMRIVNSSGSLHPMHLHGHHLLVLSRDGKTNTGSPWWVDTLNVRADEEYEVAFVADNPGIWMDHCHNLPHARDGLTMHLAYEGVATPFRLGDGPHNHPE